MEYDFSKLWAKQFFGFYEFKEFVEYASDKEAQIRYYKKLGALRVDGKRAVEGEMPQSLIDYHVESNESALDLIKNQFIVFLFARYEFVVEDTMKCLLCDDSERILKFIKVYPEYEEFIGFSLKEFIKYRSKEEYVTIISERLSSRMLAGKPSKVVNRLKCILNFADVDTNMLDELMNKRNNIVHEGEMYKIELNELENYYETIDNLLKNLALALKNIKIKVIDQGQLLSDEI